jgi:hypothetical protein
MSRFSGKQGRGAEASLRKVKRAEAEARNALTPPEKRRANRELTPESAALHLLAHGFTVRMGNPDE